MEQTDADPGVGRSNVQVHFSVAEKIRIEDTDYYCRLHLASQDCQNPVERTQAAMSSTIAKGGRISWEYNKVFVVIQWICWICYCLYSTNNWLTISIGYLTCELN